MDNANSKEYLEKIRTQVIDNLRRTTFAPSVQMTDVPRDSMAMNEEDDAELDDLDEDQNPDKRNTQHRFNKYIEKPGELSDSEDEEMNEANGVRKQPGIRKRRNRLDYRNLTDWNGDSAITSGAATPQAASSIPENDADGDVNVEDVEPAKMQEQSTASPANAANGDMDASIVPSAKPANEEEDVAMEDVGNEAAEPAADTSGTIAAQHTANVQQAVTPPYSPVGFATNESSTNGETSGAAGPTIKTEMAAEDAEVVAQAEGLAEREVQNIEGEAATEQASKTS